MNRCKNCVKFFKNLTVTGKLCFSCLFITVSLIIILIPKTVQVHYQTAKHISSISRSTCLLSFPHSGNHLVRFIGEFVTARPSYDCYSYVTGDTTLSDVMKTNFLDHVDDNRYPIFHKFHSTATDSSSYCSGFIDKCARLLFVHRNPIDSILDWCKFETGKELCDPTDFETYAKWYYDNIQFYINFLGPKDIIHYDDVVTAPNITKVLNTIKNITGNRIIAEKGKWLQNKHNYHKFRAELYQLYEKPSLRDHHKPSDELKEKYENVFKWVQYIQQDKAVNFIY